MKNFKTDHDRGVNEPRETFLRFIPTQMQTHIEIITNNMKVDMVDTIAIVAVFDEMVVWLVVINTRGGVGDETGALVGDGVESCGRAVIGIVLEVEIGVGV